MAHQSRTSGSSLAPISGLPAFSTVCATNVSFGGTSKVQGHVTSASVVSRMTHHAGRGARRVQQRLMRTYIPILLAEAFTQHIATTSPLPSGIASAWLGLPFQGVVAVPALPRRVTCALRWLCTRWSCAGVAAAAVMSSGCRAQAVDDPGMISKAPAITDII